MISALQRGSIFLRWARFYENRLAEGRWGPSQCFGLSGVGVLCVHFEVFCGPSGSFGVCFAHFGGPLGVLFEVFLYLFIRFGTLNQNQHVSSVGLFEFGVHEDPC